MSCIETDSQTFAGDEGGDDPSRVGDAGNPLLGMNQLETVISARDGRTGLSRDLQRASARGAAQRSNGQTSSARLEAVFTRIREMCALLALDGQAVQGAQHAFIIVNEQREVKTKNEKVVIAACISFASRAAGGSVRSLMEISTALGVTKKVSSFPGMVGERTVECRGRWRELGCCVVQSLGPRWNSSRREPWVLCLSRAASRGLERPMRLFPSHVPAACILRARAHDIHPSHPASFSRFWNYLTTSNPYASVHPSHKSRQASIIPNITLTYRNSAKPSTSSAPLFKANSPNAQAPIPHPASPPWTRKWTVSSRAPSTT